MAALQLEQVVVNVRAVHAIWREAADVIASVAGPNGETFDLTLSIPGIAPSCSIDQLSAKIDGTVALAEQLDAIPDVYLIPDSYLHDIDINTKSLKTAVESIAAQAAQLRAGSVSGLDIASFTAGIGGDARIKLGGPLLTSYQALQPVLSSVRRILAMTGATAPLKLEDQAKAVSDARAAQRAAVKDLANMRRLNEALAKKLSQIEKDVGEAVEKLEKDAEEIVGQLEADKTAAAAAKTNAETASSQSATHLETIKKILSEATTLKGEVSTYDSAFEDFDKALDTRNTEFAAGTDRWEKLTKKLGASEEDLNRIISRAREVLGEATVSGLSDRFAKEAKSLGGRMIVAQILFFLGIALFVVCSGAILDIFPWLHTLEIVGPYTPPPAPTGNDPWLAAFAFLGGLVGKLIFLLPSLFLIAFSAKWYAALFRLRTHYSYKYTVAASLPGFKAEAATYAEAITASAFKELLFNPAEQQGREADASEVGNSWLQRLVEPSVRRAIDKMMGGVKPKAD